MNFHDLQIGTFLEHKTNPRLSGWVRGLDSCPTAKEAQRRVWLDCPAYRGAGWQQVTERELANYRRKDDR